MSWAKAALIVGMARPSHEASLGAVKKNAWSFAAMSDHHHSHDHGDSRGHGHSHGLGGHSHAPKSFDAAFAIGTGLNVLIVVAELVFGFLAGSLALMADGAHNFSDVIGLLIAW